MQCPDCGYIMSAFDKECPKCHGRGLQKPVPYPSPSHSTTPPVVAIIQDNPVLPVFEDDDQPVAPPPAPESHSPFDYRCPVCKSEQIQKVVALLNANTWQSVGTAGGVGAVAGSVAVVGGSSRGSSSSNLALLLSPPHQIESGPAIVLAIAGLTLIFSFGLSNPSNGFYVAMLLAVCGAVWHAITRQEYMRRLSVLQERSYYCHRCGNVYDTVSKQCKAASQMRALMMVVA